MIWRGERGGERREAPGVLACLIVNMIICAQRVATLDPATQGGENVNWKVDPAPEHISQLLGWKDLGLKKIKADDSHYGDRFGRSVILHGNHLIVGADYATCQDATFSPGGVCEDPGKGAVYIYEMDYVTAPYYRWSEDTLHGGGTGSWGGWPTTDGTHSHCDVDGENCLLATGFCIDSNSSASDGLACNSANACANNGTCRYAPPFTVTGSKYWGQRIKLQPSDLSNGDRFGSSIAFDGETDTLVVGAPRQAVAARCGENYLLSVREGKSGSCAQAGAVYVFQKDFGGTNAWGQVAKMTTTPGNHMGDVGDLCDSGRETEVNGNGNCPGATCKICTNKVGTGTSSTCSHPGATCRNSTHSTHVKQHFGAAVSISKDYIAVGCPRCNGNNRCQGRCYDGSICGRCNITTTTQCTMDVQCPLVNGDRQGCQINRCQDGSFCTLWSLEQSAGKVFLYKHTGSNSWQYMKEVVPQPTGGFDELKHDYLGGNYCGNRPQGVCGTDGTVVCTDDSDCATTGGICSGGSNGGNACIADSQCPGSGKCTTTCGGLNIDPIQWTCCRDGDNFGSSLSILYDKSESDYVLAVGTMSDSTTVSLGESYDRRNHGSVYVFQQNLCCMNGSSFATSGLGCGVPYSTSDCADVWGQVKGLLSSGRPHQSPVTPAQTCGQFLYNSRKVPWVSTHVENLMQHYCWHTEKISAVDEDADTYFGRQVHLASCQTYQSTASTCLMVTRGKLYADELYVYVRNKPGYILEAGTTESGKGAGFAADQFAYGSSFKNQWALHRKHCDENYQCPPTTNSGIVEASSEATGCTCSGGYRAGEPCYADEDCQGGDQNNGTTGFSGYTWSGNCHDGQDNIGAMCTHACECTSGLLCSWHAGSLGGEDLDQISPLRYTYQTTLSAAVAADCPGGVTDQGVLTAVLDATKFRLASSAAPFEGIYVGFVIEITSESSTVDDWNQLRTFNMTERRYITAYSADRIVTVSRGFGGGAQATSMPHTSSRYKIHTSNAWDGYPTHITECPNFSELKVASAANMKNGSYLLVDDEIFHVVVSRGTDLTTLRARSGTVAAAHAQGAPVYIISGTGVQNYGVSGVDSFRASDQGSTNLLTGGFLRRCATITLDRFKADTTDNIYRNWYVAITSGVGVAQTARIMHYDGELKLAVVDCIEHGQFWTGYAQAGYSSGYTGQGYGEFSSSGNTPTPCRRSWIVPPAQKYRYFRLRVLKARSGWTSRWYSPGFACTDCCLATGWSIAEIQLFKNSESLTPVPIKISIAAATNPPAPVPIYSSVTSQAPSPTSSTNSAGLAIDDCPSDRGSEQNCGAGYVTAGLKCDSNAVACGTDSFKQESNNGATCAAYVLPSLILDLGVGKETRVDRYRFATTTLDSSLNYEPLRWVLEGTNDATAAGGDAYDPYGFCYKGLNQNGTGACKCSATGVPYCSVGAGSLGGGVNDPGSTYTPNCFCRSRWDTLDDMSKRDYDYSATELVRGAFVPSAAKLQYAGYFSVPRSTYQLCPNYGKFGSDGICADSDLCSDSCKRAVDSNGICNQGPCSEVACAGPTGDVDPLSSDYLKQAKAFASQYQPNVQVKGSIFDQLGGTTSGGALGRDITGKPMWGNPISADRASAAAGRDQHDLMAIGDYSYDNKVEMQGAVFITRREPLGDYLSYFDSYQYFPMPLPSWVD